MSYRELTAPDLVKQWKQIVNSHVVMGRDAHLLKDYLNAHTPVQVLYGFYQCANRSNISIPLFLKLEDNWLEEDEFEAELELARFISHTTPPAYYTYQELKSEESFWSIQSVKTAKAILIQWIEGVLG